MAGAQVTFYLLILVLYVVMILRYRQGFKKYPGFKCGEGVYNTGISVIVAFRNESANIKQLLKSLSQQDYPEQYVEVILVDDHSEDGSDVMVKNHGNLHANFRYQFIGSGVTGKKAAIRAGVLAARNDLVVTTDADCTMGADWLKTIAAFYQADKPDMIIGLVNANSSGGFFEDFMQTEFSALIASGAGAAAIGRPIYCNAANLAFKRKYYLDFTDPLQSVASGDDTFLLHHLVKSGKKTILLKSSDALVHTRLPENWRSFIRQRIRWASKSRFYRDFNIISSAVLVLGVNLLVIWSVYLLCAGQHQWLFPVVFAVKFLADYLLVKSYYKYLNRKIKPGKFFLYSVFYPLVTTVVAIAGIAGSYSWKGRKYRFGSKALISQF